MSTVNFNMRVEKELKDETSQIFENYGMTTAQAVDVFGQCCQNKETRCRLIIKRSSVCNTRRLSRGI